MKQASACTIIAIQGPGQRARTSKMLMRLKEEILYGPAGVPFAKMPKRNSLLENNVRHKDMICGVTPMKSIHEVNP